MPHEIKAAQPYVKNGEKIIIPSCCAIADLLGFSRAVAGARNAQESIDLMKRIDQLQTRLRWWPYEEGDPDRFKRPWSECVTFSDTVVLGVPISYPRGQAEPELGGVLDRFAVFQLFMSQEGFACRGGIACGELHVSEQLVFGKALVEAYGLHSDQTGKPPRIILSSLARKLVERHLGFYSNPAAAPQAKQLLIDEADNEVFVDYLSATNYSEYGTDWQMLTQHQEFIQHNLEQHKGHRQVRQKYEWLARYHDFFCDNRVWWTEENPPLHGDTAYLRVADDSCLPQQFKLVAEGDPHGMTGKLRF